MNRSENGELRAQRHRGRNAIVAFLLALFALAPLGATASAQTSQPGQTLPSGFDFAVRPYSAPGSAPRDFFDFGLAAGQTITDRVSITNLTADPKDFYIYPSQAYNTSVGGGFALQERNQQPSDVSSWITLPAAALKVDGHSAALLEFKLAVPSDAEPGDHAAGIVAEEIPPPGQRQGGTLTRIHRVAARVYLRVAGPIHPALQVQKISVSHHDPLIPFASDNTTKVQFAVANVGNVRVHLDDVTLRVTGLLGHRVKTFDIKAAPPNAPQTNNSLPDILLPKNSALFAKSWQSIIPLDVLNVAVIVKGDDPVLHKPVNVTRTVRVWVIPWFTLAVVALLLVAYFLWRRYRRDHPKSKPVPPAKKPTSPSAAPVDPWARAGEKVTTRS